MSAPQQYQASANLYSYAGGELVNGRDPRGRAAAPVEVCQSSKRD
jgi:hypothetical protein